MTLALSPYLVCLNAQTKDKLANEGLKFWKISNKVLNSRTLMRSQANISALTHIFQTNGLLLSNSWQSLINDAKSSQNIKGNKWHNFQARKENGFTPKNIKH